ncbi:hypothetical protein CLIB1423_06S06546 [[Candida] railenensis]|uniref:ubiquitinyl hydrolase 1 n=1 Tax=[Candida] railenensis TaxID=45579 RepID=A0A9P0QPP1_9ASCO|nr:hypothetical protein CLIB1423_06S06546 [[Candida] railenensis]
MFRKKFTRGASANDIRPAFDEHFWSWYVDSYSRNSSESSSGKSSSVVTALPHNSKKYNGSSTSVITVRRFFEQLKLDIPSNNEIIALLKSPFTQGDITKTFQLIRFFQLSSQGLFITNENRDKFGLNIQYVGAENWENVMCYLDALLFAMFANLESFEPILFVSNNPDRSDQYLVNQLSGLLRVYVNMLRSGNLITTDLTMRLCEVLMKLGFLEAMSHKQQDCASLFEFLTEILSMPLLTFKIDIKHGGKFNKEDDEKYSRERILFVSIPNEEEREKFREIGKQKEESEPASGTGDTNFPYSKDTSPNDAYDDSILLEECLEHYFNNSISVKRELERRATLESLRFDSKVSSSPIPENSSTSFEKDAPGADVFEVAPSISNARSSNASTLAERRQSNRIPAVRTRSSTLSIWSLNEVESPNSTGTGTSISSKTRSRRNSVANKEVSLPAWMFLRLLPFYTDDNEINNLNGKAHSIAKNSKEFVNRRPILPICLKRYAYSDSTATKAKRRIIIPPIINLPNFVADEEEEEVDGVTGSFKLILESAVCHRGTSISSGHFVSVIRKNTNNLQETDEEAINATWYLYDDLGKKGRVVEKQFKEIFEKEWPYMLFYRLVSNEECGTESNNSSLHNLVLPPQGYNKNKYWKDDVAPTALSPIVSNTNSNEDINSLSKTNSESSTNSSIPIIPDILPVDSKYVDIRNKYFWYVIDNEKNYYKEISVPSRAGTREPSVTISPQFRRNSQWSDSSTASVGVGRPEDQGAVEELHSQTQNLNIANVSSLTSSTGTATPGSPTVAPGKWRLGGKSKSKKEKSPSVSPSQEPVLSLDQTISPIALEQQKQHAHIKHGAYSKKNKKKGDEYRKEKCTIM